MNDLILQLTQCLGADSVLTGAEAQARLAEGSQASVLLLPRSTVEVSHAVALCHRQCRAVVPQGGLTGLVRGAVCGSNEVALSLERMRTIEEVDVVNRTMTAQAGVPLQVAQEAANERGLMLPLDLGARGTATIGGNVATNAGGTRVLRFGMMREIVLGLEAVLADGTVIDARSKLIKNNSGYDLKQLFIGTEGTLGIVTGAVLRLRPLPRSQSTALVAIDRFESVVKFLAFIEANLSDTLSSFEVMWRDFYALMTTAPAHGRAAFETSSNYYVLVETLGRDQTRDDERLAHVLEVGSAEGLFNDAVLARNAAQRRELWSVREDLAQLGRDGPVFAYDVSLTLDAMEGYVADVERQLNARFDHPRVYVFGHLADGNLHLAIGVREPGVHAAVDAIVYGSLPDNDSSVSAEHGIGLSKKEHLPCSRSEAELTLMRALKRAIDPMGVLNPGKIFDLLEPKPSRPRIDA